MYKYMAFKEQAFANENETLETTEPSAWELISFLISKLPDEKQEELAEDMDLLNLVMAVKNESGENSKNLRKLAIMEKNLNAVARLGQMLTPPLTTEEIIKRWMLDSVKKDQAKKKMN